MKEFEKCFGTPEEAYESYGYRDMGEYGGERRGWRAALKFVLSNKRFCQECDFNIDVDIIEEELDGCQEF